MKTQLVVGAGLLFVSVSQTPHRGAWHGAAVRGESHFEAIRASAPVSFAHRIGTSAPRSSAAREAAAPEIPSEALTKVVQQYCVACHNNQLLTGNLSLQGFDVAKVAEMAEIGEKVIGKLRLRMMPPPGVPRPGGDTLLALVETLETALDKAAAATPDPGARTFQRLNRAEYANSIRELLGLEIDPEMYLPPDTKSDNFDNIADVQIPSPTVMAAYLNAASKISRMAVGDRATTRQTTYTVPRGVSQTVHIEGTPKGTRGGISVRHTFTADGEYVFKASYYTTLTGNFYGRSARGEQLEVSVDGERVAMIEVDRFLSEADPTGVWRESHAVFVKAGQHRVSAAFIKTSEGAADDVISPIRQSLADLDAGSNDGMTLLPHLWQFVVSGPREVTGISDTPVRRRIFTCRPTESSQAPSCARQILSDLGTRAYRRALSNRDIERLMSLYESGDSDGGFEIGVRTAIEGILSSPDFLFRVETASGGVTPGEAHRIDDVDLASRLSFFLWGGPPDEELVQLADEGRLSDQGVLRGQVRRMLADPRSDALTKRFFAQWLRLADLDKVEPDTHYWPDFDITLRDAMRRETELFVRDLVQEDRGILNLLTADYTFVNEPLARHYGIPDVPGRRFRRVTLQEDERRGLLGQGSVLVQTSHGDRTSPVLRGKWVMEVLLSSPPPPPPPNVPAFEETEDASAGRSLTVKERMELHRANPVCSSCHQYIDPLGLALENFDVTGEWRINDSGNRVDASGRLWDGTSLSGPGDLREALLRYRVSFLRTFAKNLMTYALGRRVEHYDYPLIRKIVSAAEKDDYCFSSFVVALVESDAFRMRRVLDAKAEDLKH